MRRIRDSSWVPALAGLALSLVFAAALLIRAGGDVSLLVHAGPPWSSAAEAPGSLTVQSAERAFDGQFFYRLGADPWSTEETVAGVTNDLPSLRNARWGYGAAAWLFSAGDVDLVPWSLLGLNVVAMAVVGAAGGALARSSRHHSGWGVLFVLWPGFAYSLSMDTSELVASACVLGGLVAVRHQRWLPAAALMSAALITRDTTAVVPFGVAAAGAWALYSLRGNNGGRETERSSAIGQISAGGGALVVFAVWQLVQRARFGSLPLTSSGDNNLAFPLVGLIDELRTMGVPSTREEVFRLLSATTVIGLICLAARRWGATSASLAERLAWAASVAVVLLLNAYLWSGATAFMRASTEAALLSLILVLGRSPSPPGAASTRVLSVTAAVLSSVWLMTAVAQLTKL